MLQLHNTDHLGELLELLKLAIGAKEPEYMEVRKSTSFGGVD